ncbi:SGNH/GDSL hydrolase family protein [Deinococcus detaillensis]|uniref:SGNH/GDSL hydrolase family protein n=1 Tax=Deinococcus detaillensis TaxID=2592048 RepID=A0A553V4F9_9DEIO|nr:SGNH/GDSL hydrolase family protein [Deinococcus detaillensis]TSA87336.1 SGNH/GDSL hydrolase family protein [Deinococcus detaillensis]
MNRLSSKGQRRSRMGFAAVLALLSTLSAASAPSPPASMTYVALGDSLTAGFQSGGLTAEDQREAYPAVIAQLARIPFGVPAGGGPGCPPPLGAAGLSAASCLRLDPAVRGSNFAVPGAKVADLLSRSAKNAGDDLTRRLYTLILGPDQTQVQAALKSKPRFVSLWIGSNDVLNAAASGDLSQATSPHDFEAAYRQLLSALAPAKAQLLLLTVPDVTTAPVLVAGQLLYGYGLADASCQHSPNKVAATWVITHAPVSCGAPYALTPAKLSALQQIVAAYNASIHRLAQERGLPVFDVAPLLAGLQRPDPNPASPQPFGPDFSQDGVHPSAQTQAKLARAIVTFGNAELKLGVALP